MREVEKIFADLGKANKNSVYKADTIPDYEVISTGSLSLDEALGIGGVPNNRVIQISGAPGAGKTTLAINIVKNALMKYPESYAMWLDLEGRMDKHWLKAHIPDSSIRERIYVLFPSNAEQATDWFEKAIDGGELSVVVWDSIGAAPTKAEQEKSAEISNFGGNSKSISRFARSAGPLANKWKTLVIGINQVREDLKNKYVQWSFPSGMAWKHAISANIFLRASEAKDGKKFEFINGIEKQVGYLVSALIMKNSFAAPFMKAEYWFYNIHCDGGFGIDLIEEIIRLSTVLGVVDQRGAWFYHESLPDGKVQGRANLIDLIKTSPGLQETITKQTKIAISNSTDLSGVIDSFNPEEILVEEAVDMSWLKNTYA